MQGSWEHPFKKEATLDADFHVTKDKTVKVPTMHQTETFRYGESAELDAKILELPYEGGEASFVIILPNKIDGLKDLEEKLKDPTALKKALDITYPTEVVVSLPKFKIETTTNLKEVLQNMHVERLFTAGEARLDNLLEGEGNLYISDAIQKAFIEVNEEGAEAAAANEFSLDTRFGYDSESFEANRPFYFHLNSQSLTIFSGTYSP